MWVIQDPFLKSMYDKQIDQTKKYINEQIYRYVYAYLNWGRMQFS